MRIVNYAPPSHIYDKAKELWGVDFDAGVIFTYGDTVHVASGTLTEDLAVHEQTHIAQQAVYAGGPDAWYDRYFTDPEFRLHVESQAYREQVRYLARRTGKDKFNLSKQFAILLSGKMYGNMVNIYQALNLINE